MRNLHSIALLSALLGSAACGDDNNADDTTTLPSSANAVIPADGFAGRTLRVQISGDNTTWDGSSTVSFGDGITVGTVTAASPTDLIAEITIAPTAAIGLRDVKVTAGGVDSTLTQAFEITSPVTTTFTGTIANGSIALFTLTNHDFDNPFDTTSTGDGFFTPLVFTNLEVAGPAGATLNVSNVAPYSASGTILLDVDAVTGALSVKSGPSGGTIVTSPAESVTVAHRDATPLTAGTSVNATVAKALDSQLYSFGVKATTSTVVAIGATTTNANATPTVFLLPSSGKWADEVTSGANVAQVVSADTNFYAVTLDTAGVQGFQYTVAPASVALTNTLNEVEPNNSALTAQTATIPTSFTTAAGAATLSDDNDQDWIKVTVPAGKKLHVISYGGDDMTDNLIDIYKADGTTLVIESDDSGYLDSVTTGALTAGTYLVKVSVSSFGLVDPAINHYELAIFAD